MIMKRPTKPIENKKDRAPPEQDPFSAIRLSPKLTAAIDKWAEENGVSSRSEAISPTSRTWIGGIKAIAPAKS
jgi:hypothetical protein